MGGAATKSQQGKSRSKGGSSVNDRATEGIQLYNEGIQVFDEPPMDTESEFSEMKASVGGDMQVIQRHVKATKEALQTTNATAETDEATLLLESIRAKEYALNRSRREKKPRRGMFIGIGGSSDEDEDKEEPIKLNPNLVFNPETRAWEKKKQTVIFADNNDHNDHNDNDGDGFIVPDNTKTVWGDNELDWPKTDKAKDDGGERSGNGPLVKQIKSQLGTANSNSKNTDDESGIDRISAEASVEVTARRRTAAERRGVIDMSRQELPLIPMHVYNSKTTGPDKILELRASANQLTYIPEVIGQLSSLTILHLDQNKISSLPVSFTRLQQLRRLLLHENEFETLPAFIGCHTTLELLTLTANKLTTLPPEMGQLTRLSDLILGEMEITAPPKEVLVQGTRSVLAFLRQVLSSIYTGNANLSGAGLLVVPSDLKTMVGLTQLDLSNNRLAQLPALPLYKLHSLNLDDNKFDHVPATVYQDMVGLAICSIRRNPIVRVPLEVAGLRSLRTLNLSITHTLIDPPHQVVKNEVQLPYLRHVVAGIENTVMDLSNFNLDQLPAPLDVLWDSIPGMDNLLEIWLNANLLTDIFTGLQRWTRLTGLELEDNRLGALPAIIGKIHNLTHLNLGRNRLKTLPPEMAQLTALTELFLDHNMLEEWNRSLSSLQKLRYLSLEKNNISVIPTTISRLSEMQRLNLCDNPLTSALNLAALSKITDLNVGGCNLANFPLTLESLSSLVELEDISLSNNGLLQLPDVAVYWTNLRNIDLSNNRIEELGSHIHLLTNLVKINLNANPLRLLPLRLGLLRNMRVLRFDVGSEWISPPTAVMRLGGSAALEYMWEMAESFTTCELSLKEKDLLYFPPDLVEVTNMTRLSIANNKISCLPSTISKLINLTDFTISGNPIDELPLELALLTNLKQLRIGRQFSLKIPTHEVLLLGTNSTLKYLKLLTEARESCALTVNHYQLQTIPKEILSIPQGLTFLNLQSNVITKVPPELGDMATLETLILRHNRIKSLPSSLSGLRRLLSLDVAHNRFQQLDTCVGFLTTLTSLNLDGNELLMEPIEFVHGSFQEFLRYLRCLAEIYETGKGGMKAMQLTDIPERVFTRASSLVSLSFARNDIHSLDTKIDRLVHLTRLDLSHNKLESLPFEISCLSSLRSLVLDHNKFSKVQLPLLQLPSLSILSLIGNQLRSDMLDPDVQAEEVTSPLVGLILDGNIMGQLNLVIPSITSLTLLSIRNNELMLLPHNFGQLANLQELWATDNNLIEFPESFRALTALTYLDVTNNNLQRIPGWFGDLPRLQRLHLQNNQLVSLPWDLLRLTQLVEMHVEGNPLPMLAPDILNAGTQAILEFLRYNQSVELTLDDRTKSQWNDGHEHQRPVHTGTELVQPLANTHLRNQSKRPTSAK